MSKLYLLRVPSVFSTSHPQSYSVHSYEPREPVDHLSMSPHPKCLIHLSLLHVEFIICMLRS
jgi:hypothetical protein